MNMASHRLHGPNCNGPTNGSRERLEAALRRLKEIGVEPPTLQVCDPANRAGPKLHDHLMDVEEGLRLISISHETQAVVGTIDKSRQNPINYLGGKEGAGNSSMEAYFRVAGEALALVAAMNGSQRIGLHLARVTPTTSDEGVVVISGNGLSPSIKVDFHKAWAFARERLDLKGYTYTLVVPHGASAEEFRLDLDGFSRILKHPESVVACSSLLTNPMQVRPDSKRGFLLDALRELENSEIMFREFLPETFRRMNGGLPEVQSPFDNNLMSGGVERLGKGCFSEIKLAPQIAADLRGVLPFLSDGWGAAHGIEGRTRGTRKGHAEIFSGVVGMRFLNTILGKARANSVLTPIAQGMGDLKASGIAVIPVTGGYLQYWLNLAPTETTAALVRGAIERRIRSDVPGDPGYAKLLFDPRVMVLDAANTAVADTRARFILASLGRGGAPQELHRTDFLLNYIENVADRVRGSIEAQLALRENGGAPITQLDSRYFHMISEICGVRRTIRDTEDLVWVLRNDPGLPGIVQRIRKDLEKWIFDFANERFERISLLLARRIEKEIRER